MLEWLRSNKSNPYASSKAKLDLSAKTNLSTDQVAWWLMYTRQRSWFRKEMDEFLSQK